MIRPDLHLPPSFLAWLAPYLAAFSRRTRSTVAALATGALLAVGPRTVTNCLRALGLAEHPGFAAFHRVLNRNTWSGLALARTLLRMTVVTFVPSGPIIIGIDHTLERRRGPHIGPAGRFYDPSRRADMPKPTSRGLRWLSAMVLVEVPFAGAIWALPVLTVLAPSKAWCERQGRRYRPVTATLGGAGREAPAAPAKAAGRLPAADHRRAWLCAALQERGGVVVRDLQPALRARIYFGDQQPAI
jgi:hypothetical protein